MIWSNLCTLLLDHGALWAVVGRKLSRYPDQALQAQLFAAPKFDYDLAIIGDPAFCKTVRAAAPARARSLELCLSIPTLLNVGHALAAAASLRAARLVVQNLPYFWTNSAPDAYAPVQDLALWRRASAQREFRLVSREDARLVFTTLARWAKAPGPVASSRSNSDAPRVPSMMNLEFRMPANKTQPGYYSATAGFTDADWRKVYWIAEFSRMPPDADPGLMAEFEGTMRGNHFVPGLGHVGVDLSTLFNPDVNRS